MPRRMPTARRIAVRFSFRYDRTLIPTLVLNSLHRDSDIATKSGFGVDSSHWRPQHASHVQHTSGSITICTVPCGGGGRHDMALPMVNEVGCGVLAR